MMIFFFN